MPAPQPTPTNDYGLDRFVIGENGERLRVLSIRTIEPSVASGESNAQFLRRMHQLAIEMRTMMRGVLAVEYEIEWKDGHAVRCLLSYFTEPTVHEIVEDYKPAGGRFGERGSRGGQRAAA